MNLPELKKKLANYPLNMIIISKHASMRAELRSFDISQIKENIHNPEKLYYFEEQKAKLLNERKFNCYFRNSKKYCHRYIIIINNECIVCTVIRININMQKRVDKYAKI